MTRFLMDMVVPENVQPPQEINTIAPFFGHIPPFLEGGTFLCGWVMDLFSNDLMLDILLFVSVVYSYFKVVSAKA